MPKKYPLEFKKQAIRRYEKGESIPALCQELHVSQSTFYHWRNQYRSIQTSAHTYTPAEFDALVRRLQKAEHKLSIIQLSGYLSKVPLQDKLATLEHFHNEMSDLYSVHELCEALDRVSHAASTRLVTTTFRNAYEERGNPKNLTFHSDRGGQYISAAFSKLLQQYNVKQSFSASGTPLDNAVAEAFFSTFKKEETYRREYTSERHFRKSVDEYIRFYNEVRPHQTLKYKTPQAFEATYQSSYIEKPCSYNAAGV